MAVTVRLKPEQEKMLEGVCKFMGVATKAGALVKAAQAHEGLVKVARTLEGRIEELEGLIERQGRARETRDQALAEVDRSDAELAELAREGEKLIGAPGASRRARAERPAWSRSLR